MPGTAELELRVHLVQTILHWEDIPRNLEHFDGLIAPLKGKTDLVLLPEMFTSGFTMNAKKVAQSMDGSAVQWMKEQARKLDAAICGSLVIGESGAFFNRLLFVEPNGTLSIYNKKHLFRLAREERIYKAGHEQKTVHWKGFDFNLFVCYDLRFPVWCRNEAMADAMIFVANWPEKRALAWNTLLQARAIENQCYVLGVNRVGTDPADTHYVGDSAVYGPEGEPLAHNRGDDCILGVTLRKNDLARSRRRFQFYKDMDAFILK